MKKVILSLAIVAIGFAANAQDSKKDDQQLRFSVGAEVAVPLGDLKEFSSLGFGGSVQGEYKVAETIGITLNAGYLTFPGKTETEEDEEFKMPTTSIIPVLAGAKFYFSEKFYGHAQLGMSFFSMKLEGVSASSSAFTYAPAIGFAPSENFDISVKYQAASKAGSTTSFVGARIAYTF